MSNFLWKTEDIQMTLQLSECLSATNIWEQNLFPTCDFMFMQHIKSLIQTRLVEL